MGEKTMSPLRTVEYLIQAGWCEKKAIRFVQKNLMIWKWGDVWSV